MRMERLDAKKYVDQFASKTAKNFNVRHADVERAVRMEYDRDRWGYSFSSQTDGNGFLFDALSNCRKWLWQERIELKPIDLYSDHPAYFFFRSLKKR